MGRKEDLDAEMARAIQHWKPNKDKGGKATYTKTNVLGKEQRHEGRAAIKASKRNEKK